MEVGALEGLTSKLHRDLVANEQADHMREEVHEQVSIEYLGDVAVGLENKRLELVEEGLSGLVGGLEILVSLEFLPDGSL